MSVSKSNDSYEGDAEELDVCMSSILTALLAAYSLGAYSILVRTLMIKFRWASSVLLQEQTTRFSVAS